MSLLPEPDVPCAECHRMLRWFQDRGYGHVRGGGPIWFGCEDCYHSEAWWPLPERCPRCNGRLLDLHVAQPTTAKKTTA